jgi:hypothetical protein
VLRRLLVVLALLVVAVPAAAAATVHVRVEGKTRTIWGPTDPPLAATTALDSLDAASAAGEFYFHVTVSGFGPYVDQVGRYGGSGTSGWVFKVNDVSPPVGADKVTLKDGDRVLWYYADFGPAGGPPTLELTASRGCYVVVAYDDNGKPTAVPGERLQLGSKRSVPVTGAKTCPGPHPGLLVRAVAPGAIRSNALR